MGEYINLSQALLVAAVSIIAVFVVLILIAFIIDGLKAFSGEDKKKESIKPETIKETPVAVKNPNEITEELVAVIAAALAANLGVNVSNLNIKTIRRLPNMSSAWSNVGSIKQTIGRL